MASIHFISGLPRSGSTLLAALLRQNPRQPGGGHLRHKPGMVRMDAGDRTAVPRGEGDRLRP